MTRSKLADLTEILSSIAILVTLMYLTVEVRQNTEALRAQSRETVLEASQTELRALFDKPEVGVAILEPGRLLSPDESVMVDAWLSSVFRTREFAWLQYRDGSVDADQWATERQVLSGILGNPLPRRWWQGVGRANAGAEFAAFVDSMVAATPISDAAWNLRWYLPDDVR